jgi:hypothetical protein
MIQVAMPEVGLEPTRPCGQRILSANRTRGQVALVSRSCKFLGNGACGSARDSCAETPAPNTLPNSFGTEMNRRQAASRVTSRYARRSRSIRSRSDIQTISLEKGEPERGHTPGSQKGRREDEEPPADHGPGR